jgi:hypothetical protein
MFDITISIYFEHLFIKNNDTILGITPYNGSLKRTLYEMVLFGNSEIIGVDDI